MDVDAIPTQYQDIYRRAMTGGSRKAAIRAHCLMCVGWVSAEVDKCTAPDCPLFKYRLPLDKAVERELEATQTPELVSLDV